METRTFQLMGILMLRFLKNVLKPALLRYIPKNVSRSVGVQNVYCEKLGIMNRMDYAFSHDYMWAEKKNPLLISSLGFMDLIQVLTIKYMTDKKRILVKYEGSLLAAFPKHRFV